MMRTGMGDRLLPVGALILILADCGETARLPENAGVGASPKLPPPERTHIPTVHIAPV